MAKAIFTTKADPTYDDLPEERYHFPRTYLRQVEAALADWIVYYEPRRRSGDLSSRGGRLSYFATARVDRVEPDPARQDHFYAFVSEFLEFDRPVPFKEGYGVRFLFSICAPKLFSLKSTVGCRGAGTLKCRRDFRMGEATRVFAALAGLALGAAMLGCAGLVIGVWFLSYAPGGIHSDWAVAVLLGALICFGLGGFAGARVADRLVKYWRG
jgi:hypothetical protein